MPSTPQNNPPPTAGPLVSIIIPVYNGIPFIEATIDSVRRQTYSNWELLICENQSKDGTAACVENLLKQNPDDRIRLIVHDKLLPMADNWNRALPYARGEFIKVLPSDDILLPDCIEIQQRILQERPNVGFVTSGKEVIDATGKKLFTRKPLPEGEYNWHTLGLRTIYAIANVLGEPGAILFRKDLLASCGAYDPRLKYFVDVELLLRFLKKSNAYVWGGPLYQFRVHGSSASSSSTRPALDEYMLVLDEYKDELRLSSRPWLKPWLRTKSRLVVSLRNLVFRFYNR